MKTQKSGTVTVLKVNNRQWQSKDLMYIHYLEFDNGDKGEYFSNSPECPEFSMNKLVPYLIEQRGFLGNKPIFRINPVKESNTSNSRPQSASNDSEGTQRPFKGNNGSNKPQRNENAIMAQHAITKSVEIFASGGIEIENLYPKALEILQWTHKFGNMSSEDIANLPVEFIPSEGKKGKGKGGNK